MRLLSQWCAQHRQALPTTTRAMPQWIEEYDRMADCWETLFAVADIAGSDWPSGPAGRKISNWGRRRTDLTNGVTLLAHINEAFLHADRHGDTKTLIDRLSSRPEIPWNDMGKDKPLTDRGLADLLPPME